jgi:alkylation response protein AidB-like acyl-CoA dehydrogenase
MATEESADLIALAREVADKELRPAVADAEATDTSPREVFRVLGRTGLLGLPYAEDVGAGGQSYEVYLQVVEELAPAWASVGVGVRVHALSCFGSATVGTPRQQQEWLPDMLSGSSPPSRPAARRRRRRRRSSHRVGVDVST